MAFENVTVISYIPVMMPNTVAIRWQPQAMEMEAVGSIDGTGYSLYSGRQSFVATVGGVASIDLRASGPKGTVEKQFIVTGGGSASRQFPRPATGPCF